MVCDRAPMTMNYTGERMVPELADRLTFWEHIYRYRFACQFVKGLDVLDVACGEGYGSAAILKAGASSIKGMDVSDEACSHARNKYGIDAQVGDAENIALASGSVDLVTSFETIEHLRQPDRFLDEALRVLRADGKLIISTPDAAPYRLRNACNPFHFKELTESDFVALLSERFKRIQLFTQYPVSAGWWSPRALASEHSPFRGFRRCQNLIRRIVCPELVSRTELESARKDPVRYITKSQPRLARLANPYSVRPKSSFAREVAMYVIAVASPDNNEATIQDLPHRV
jgi:SAM-dependent methyltransferase